MTKEEARNLLYKIIHNPGLADQFTEDEIEEIEELASR